MPLKIAAEGMMRHFIFIIAKVILVNWGLDDEQK